jgi:RND family efflux transporter MFP subunit
MPPLRLSAAERGCRAAAAALLFLSVAAGTAGAADADKGPQERKSPVRVAAVEIKTVAEQVSLVGTTEALAESTIASETAGVVEQYPVREGDYVQKGDLLAQLRTTYLKLSLKGARASRQRTLANLKNAEKELKRIAKLRQTNSVAEKAYDDALYNYQALTQELLRNEAEIDQLQYELDQARVTAPFSGFVAVEHTAVGEWVSAGGPVVTLIDLSSVQITVDVPERYIVKLAPSGTAEVRITALDNERLSGEVTGIIPQGNPAARTFPVHVQVANPGLKIKGGMEAAVTFSLNSRKEALLVPKDAIVTSGALRSVVTVVDGRAMPVGVKVVGYYDSSVAVEGRLKPGDPVVIRGNERLRPGQAVAIQN